MNCVLRSGGVSEVEPYMGWGFEGMGENKVKEEEEGEGLVRAIIE